MAIAVVSLLCAGCSSLPGASTNGSAPSSSASTAPSIPPESPIAPFTASPSIEPSAEPTPASPDVGPAMPEPPPASLAVEGGDPVVGELGSLTWRNSGSDAPWVPGTPMRVGRGEQLTLTLATDVRIETWTVRRTPTSTIGSGVIGMGEGSAEPVTFAAPPAGSWSVSVNVLFAGNLGSAAYYWLIAVD